MGGYLAVLAAVFWRIPCRVLRGKRVCPVRCAEGRLVGIPDLFVLSSLYRVHTSDLSTGVQCQGVVLRRVGVCVVFVLRCQPVFGYFVFKRMCEVDHLECVVSRGVRLAAAVLADVAGARVTTG